MSWNDEYLKSVQGVFKTFCYHVNNEGKMKENAENEKKGKKVDDRLPWYPSKFHKFLCDSVQDFVSSKNEKAFEILIINTPPQHGKLIADFTPVLTKDGWKKHGDLEVGDYVLNHKGDFVKVTCVHPKYKANRVVTFLDGSKIYCHENHEWLVNDRDNHKEHVLETKKIESRLVDGEMVRGNRYNFQLPLREPIKGEHKELYVEPYVLGVWLGDSKNQGGQICSAKEDRVTIDEVRKYYPNGAEWEHKDTHVIYASYIDLYKGLQKYGMCYSLRRTEKYIPSDYLTASIEQRLELLGGLIDTDGYVDAKHNRIVFTTADEKLKDTFEDLIATFGWRTTTCECKPCISSSGIMGRKTYWQIGFNPTCEIPCRIERKKLTHFSKQRRVSIVSIEPCEETQGNCITVEGGIYLVGRKMHPTHNSVTVTETFPAWYLMRNPDKKVIVISYGDDLAKRFGKRNLEKIQQYGYLFGVTLDKSKANSEEMEIKDHSGRMISRGLGSGITGQQANLLVIDDPIKNAKEADSPTYRDSVWEEFGTTVKTRLSANGKVILIMTRWHEDDLAGRIIQEYGDRTTVLNIPCEAEEDDILGREVGEALLNDMPSTNYEMRKDNTWLKDFKKSYMSANGTRQWNALFQGRPTAMEGNLLQREWWQFYDKSEWVNGNMHFDTMIMSVDASFKNGEENDYVAISVWGKIDARIYLVDMINEHLDFPSTVRKIKIMKARYPNVTYILIEDKANGTGVIQVLKTEILGIVAVHPDASKEARVQSVSFAIEAGNVYLPKDKPYAENFTWNFIDQCASFPNAKHDDMVDSMSQALSRLIFTKAYRRKMKRNEAKFSFHEFKDTIKKPLGIGNGEKIKVI